MTTDKVMLICGKCSMRIRGMDAADVPERGIVCRCGNRMLPGELKVDPGRRKPRPLPECSLRGEQLSTVDCKCAGQVKVFACSHADNADGLALSYRPSQLRGLPEDSLPSCRNCPFNKQEPPKPTLLQMGMSAAVAGYRFVAGGGKVLPRDRREARLTICKGCPALNGSQCVDCGCFVAVKTWLPKEKCPRNKWPSPPATP